MHVWDWCVKLHASKRQQSYNTKYKKMLWIYLVYLGCAWRYGQTNFIVIFFSTDCFCQLVHLHPKPMKCGISERSKQFSMGSEVPFTRSDCKTSGGDFYGKGEEGKRNLYVWALGGTHNQNLWIKHFLCAFRRWERWGALI